MTTYEEALRLQRYQRPALSRTIVLEHADDILDDDDLLRIANIKPAPGVSVSKSSDGSARESAASQLVEEDVVGEAPVIPTVSDPKPEYVMVKTHNKRVQSSFALGLSSYSRQQDGTVREYAVRKGTPLSEVLQQYARDTGVDEEQLRQGQQPFSPPLATSRAQGSNQSLPGSRRRPHADPTHPWYERLRFIVFLAQCHVRVERSRRCGVRHSTATLEGSRHVRAS